MAEIKPNSIAYKKAQQEADSNSGGNNAPAKKAKLKEKSFKSKLKDAFIAEDVVDIKDYIIFTALIPQIKKLARNLLVNTIDMKFFGKSLGTGNRGRLGGEIRDYTRAYDSPRRLDDEDEYRPRRKSQSAIGLRDLDLVMFQDEQEAVEVLVRLRSSIDDYGIATVSDFLENSGLQASNIHRKWGWYNLNAASVKLDTDEDMYYIDLPKPKPID